MESMEESSKLMLPLPKLEKQADWPAFWRVMKYWLRKKKYSPSKINKLQHVSAATDFKNEQASMNVSDALLLILKGDALAKFECQNDSYKDQGFKMLSVVKKDWDS